MIHALKPCLTLLCIGSSLVCFAQEGGQSVISSAGDVSKGGGVILEWTVGEPAIETVSTSSTLYTQGFHQPVLQVQKLNTGIDMATLQNKILVYPNPVTSVINIQLEKPSHSELVVWLMDETGKLILNNRLPINSSSLKLNVSRLNPGAYMLHITDASGAVWANYKIIKTSK